MKKLGKHLPAAFLILCILAFAVYFYQSNSDVDTTAPEIRFAAESISLSVYDSEEALLSGVTAEDNCDGDVSASLVVEGISAISADHTATVTYAAFDSAGNVTKSSRQLTYTDYSGPSYSLSAPLLFRSGYTFDILDYLAVSDPIDGDLTDKIKATLVSGGSSITEEGLHEVEVRVTNSMGDTSRLTLPVEVFPVGTYNAELKLKDYLIYIEKGSAFLPEHYMDVFSTGYLDYSLEDPASNAITLDITSNVNASVPGTYSVTYTASRDTYTACTRMIVIVEDSHHA